MVCAYWLLTCEMVEYKCKTYSERVHYGDKMYSHLVTTPVLYFNLFWFVNLTRAYGGDEHLNLRIL